MKPTLSSRRAFFPTSLLAAALLVALSGCGAVDSADDTTSADARTLFGRDAEQCRPFLNEAEEAQSEAEQRAALERYEVCIAGSEHMPVPSPGRSVDSCYDILEAVVRIQDDVSADIIRQLHDAYVDCVYDAVTGDGDPDPNPGDCEAILREGEERCFGPDGQEPGQDGEECWDRVEREYNACIGDDPNPNPDDCYGWAHEVCAPLLNEEQADGSMGDEAFARCIEAHLDMCDPGSNPNDCEVILREGEERCFGPEGQPWEGEDCWAQVEYEYNACISDDPDPNPDDCYSWAHEVCEPLLYEEQADGSMGDEAFVRCLEAHLDMCDPGSNPNDCEAILREGEERCFGPDGERWEGEDCWAQVEYEYNACLLNNPDEGPDSCDEWAYEVCAPFLNEEQADGSMGDEAFVRCIEEHLPLCNPNPDDCDAILSSGEERCFGPDGNPMEDPQLCWEQLEREYQACIEGDQPDPNLEQCLNEGQRRCEELLNAGMDNGPDGEPIDVAFGECLAEVQRSCNPEPDPTDACVERAHDRCAGLLDGAEGQDPDQDPAASFERCLEAELDACFNDPDPGQCEFILQEAQQACSMADGDLDEQCLDAHRQEYERCLMGR